MRHPFCDQHNGKDLPIQLGVNYSRAAAHLKRSGKVTFDRFKSPPWPQVVHTASTLAPVYVHFDFHLGGAELKQTDLEAASQWFGTTDTRFVNAHPPPSLSATKALEDLNLLCARFGAERVLVENIPLESTPGSDHSVAVPKHFNELIHRSGCGFLLDLAHARWSAETLRVEILDFVSAHPLCRLRELHVTGLGVDSGGRRRDSMPMQEADWKLFEWALDNIAAGRWPRPWVVSLEYGGVGPHFAWRSKEAVLLEQLPRIARLLAERGLR